MGIMVSITEARNSLSQLIDEAEKGEEIVLTRAGKPVARIVSVDSATSTVKLPEPEPPFSREILEDWEETDRAITSLFREHLPKA